MSRGFTLFETVLAIGILAVVFLVGAQANAIFQNVLTARGSRNVESVLGTAALHARNGANGSDWGVYFVYDDVTRIATQAILFSGSSYLSRDATKDVVVSLGRDLRFTTASLSGAGVSSGNDHEIVFTFLTGTTSQYGFVTIESYASVTQIDISSTGMVVRR